MGYTRGLDGALADYYASVIGYLQETDSKIFADSYFTVLTKEEQEEVLYFFAYDVGWTKEEALAYLTAIRNQ